MKDNESSFQVISKIFDSKIKLKIISRVLIIASYITHVYIINFFALYVCHLICHLTPVPLPRVCIYCSLELTGPALLTSTGAAAGAEDDYTAHLRTSSYAMLKAEAGPQSLAAGLHQPRAFPLSSTTPASLFQSLPYIGAQQVSSSAVNDYISNR